MRRLKTLPILATLLMTLTFCAAPPKPTPPPRSAPAPSPPPAPLPAPVAWQDAPLTPGGWIYQADAQRSAAFYGNGTKPPVLAIRCDRQSRSIRVDRALPTPASSAGMMRVTTSFGDTQWPAGIGSSQPLLSVPLKATDPALDKMAYSRGRIMIEASGTERLILPAWPEMARVIEDCRA